MIRLERGGVFNEGVKRSKVFFDESENKIRFEKGYFNKEGQLRSGKIIYYDKEGNKDRLEAGKFSDGRLLSGEVLYYNHQGKMTKKEFVKVICPTCNGNTAFCFCNGGLEI